MQTILIFLTFQLGGLLRSRKGCSVSCKKRDVMIKVDVTNLRSAYFCKGELVVRYITYSDSESSHKINIKFA